MNTKKIDRSEVIGHPSGLFILFFTEMWERFSYYGMRAILVLFLVSAAGLGGWEWSNADASLLYAFYTGFVYLTPIFGGLIADKIMGFKKAVILGAVLMTAGHGALAFETEFSFYLGLVLLVVGNGFFKPNISSIVSGLYEGQDEKKDAGYTIFYMGINAGAFLGILLCGYIGEKVGWSYGFGLAGIFMLIGMLQFWFAQKMFGTIGDKPLKKTEQDELPMEHEVDGIGADDILDADQEVRKSDKETASSKVSPEKVRKDRLIVIGVLAFFTIFFWMAFEQAGSSMTIFAKDYTNRVLTGDWATFYAIINAIIVIVPMVVLTWVLIKLFKATFAKISLSNGFLGLSFLIIWGIIFWMINKDFNTKAYELSVPGYVAEVVDNPNPNIDKKEEVIVAIDEQTELEPGQEARTFKTTIREDQNLAEGEELFLIDLDKKGNYKYIRERNADKFDNKITATVIKEKDNEVEIPASWFLILNSLFIITLAPLFSKLWQSRFNPSAPVKFSFGLILLGFGFAFLAFGGLGVEEGSTTASVSMIWLVLAYLFHTLGELTLSPVGLSYVSKLSPKNLLSLMFGVWFTATFIANLLAGISASFIDKIAEIYSISTFFLIFTAIPIAAGLVLVLMNKWLIKKMHGIK